AMSVCRKACVNCPQVAKSIFRTDRPLTSHRPRDSNLDDLPLKQTSSNPSRFVLGWNIQQKPIGRSAMSSSTAAKGKHSAPREGNIYAKANEVIVKITGADTGQTFEVVEENCKPGFQSRAHYHIKAYETFYLFDGSADFQVGDELF